MFNLVKGVLLLLSVTLSYTQYERVQINPKIQQFQSILIGQPHTKAFSSEDALSRQNIRYPTKTNPISTLPRAKTLDTNSKETDTAHYTVGANFQVNHPDDIIGQKKVENPINLFDVPKATYSYTNFHLPSDNKIYKEPSIYSLKRKNPTKKPLFKPAQPELQSHFEITNLPVSSLNSHIFQSTQAFDQDPRYFKHDFKLQDVPNLYPPEKQFYGVASKGQIEKYLEDQQKIIDEAIELQLLNDPNPEAKGKYHQFLKSKDDERIEKEYEELLKKKPIIKTPNSYDSKLYSGNGDRDTVGQKGTIKKAKSQPLGLGHYRTPRLLDSYQLEISA